TTPLYSRFGALLGCFSTYWRDPHELTMSELHTLDILAREASDLIDRSQAEADLRESEARLRELAANLETRVRERTAQLTESLQSLESVLYHVAHDLRAPLRTMHSFTDVLQEEYARQLDDRGQDYIRRVAEASGRMDLLIGDLLNYGRLGHQAVVRVPVN